jgi:hypothetical protein
MSKQSETTIQKYGRIGSIVPLLGGIFAFLAAMSSFSGASTWISGEYTFNNLTSCQISSLTDDICLPSVNWSTPGAVFLIVGVLFVAIAVVTFFYWPASQYVGGVISKQVSKFQDSSRKTKELKERPVRAQMKVKTASRNFALVNFKAGTSQLIWFGIGIGLIAALILVNARTDMSYVWFAYSIGIISTWMLFLGLLGKLLLGAAKVIIEGLNGNTREEDEFSTRQED